MDQGSWPVSFCVFCLSFPSHCSGMGITDLCYHDWLNMHYGDPNSSSQACAASPTEPSPVHTVICLVEKRKIKVQLEREGSHWWYTNGWCQASKRLLGFHKKKMKRRGTNADKVSLFPTSTGWRASWKVRAPSCSDFFHFAGQLQTISIPERTRWALKHTNPIKSYCITVSMWHACLCIHLGYRLQEKANLIQQLIARHHFHFGELSGTQF